TPVVILPGFPGSRLIRADNAIAWIDVVEVAFRKAELLRDLVLTEANWGALTCGGVLDTVEIPPLFDPKQYLRLTRFLQREIGLPPRAVKGFGYDWRKSIHDAALDLQQSIADWVEGDFAGAKCSIIAHSTGGLVARYMIECLDGGEFVEHLY